MQVHKLSPEHLATRVKWFNSDEIYSHMNMSYPITLDQTIGWYERIKGNDNRIDFAFVDNTEVVAMTGLTNLDLANGLIEFYILVGPEYQGLGYGKKTTEWTLNYAFMKFNINKVFLYTNEFNERANNLYEKLGFKLEGRFRKHKFRDGKYIDRCFYGLIKEDWLTTDYCAIEEGLKLNF